MRCSDDVASMASPWRHLDAVDASPHTVKVEVDSEDAGADLGLEPRLVGCGTIYIVAGG